MEKKKKVLAFGTFDILHAGHLHYLKKSASLGNRLIVVVARDKNVLREKGDLPLKDELHRKKLLNSLKLVDKAVLGSEKNFLRPLLEIKPDVIALGYDQKASLKELRLFLKKHDLKAKIVRIKAHKPSEFKSSFFRKKIDAGLDLGIDII